MRCAWLVRIEATTAVGTCRVDARPDLGADRRRQGNSSLRADGARGRRTALKALEERPRGALSPLSASRDRFGREKNLVDRDLTGTPSVRTFAPPPLLIG
jgi:hypothetical protein